MGLRDNLDQMLPTLSEQTNKQANKKKAPVILNLNAISTKMISNRFSTVCTLRDQEEGSCLFHALIFPIAFYVQVS